MAALQHLPPRQRAVLILREVMSWKASEVAELLDTSVASVNSALQRARATLATADVSAAEPIDDDQRALLSRYVDAFERYDLDALTALLHDDVAAEHRVAILVVDLERRLPEKEQTAEQQKETKTDRETARQIRRALMKNKSLSTYAHNVKIITQDGKVTLKGPVRTEKEKKTVEKAAATVAGKKNVTSELEVVPKED